MKLNFELPPDVLLIKRDDLKIILQEILEEVHLQISSTEVMTIREAAEFLKVSEPTIRNMIASNDIPFFRRGQVIRLNRRDIQDWLRYYAQK
ncbi:helix-turn-helix domain-containing protein [Bacillus marasmi]|uniref:helix-turn-helix domain-containing protein n=1 Tax=Bacillus marasmi TaxID=1926279 RepID=UPI0011C76B92|nr:helix-turn-helix domain-containing protein [Bacillus marasmi]